MRFNPRPRAGGDATVKQVRESVGSFNPRPRAGGDQVSNLYERESGVSIHAPARGATYLSSYTVGSSAFQSTPPRGGRLSAR